MTYRVVNTLEDLLECWKFLCCLQSLDQFHLRFPCEPDQNPRTSSLYNEGTLHILQSEKHVADIKKNLH